MTEENSNQDLDFLEQAKNLVKKIGPKLGQDKIREGKSRQLDKKNLAVIIWEASNNSLDYINNSYDTAYLVWKDKQGELKGKSLIDTKNTKYFMHVNNIIENGEYIFIRLGYTDPDWQERRKKGEVKYKDKNETTYRIKKEDYLGNEK